MAPVTVTLSPHLRGDTWNVLAFGPITIDGVAPTSNLASARLQFRNDEGTLGFEFNTSPSAEQGTFVISDAATWEVTVTPHILTLTPGTWYWDYETTDVNGSVLTLYSGVQEITADVTRD